MYKAIDDRIRKALRHHIHERYKTDVEVTTERPPRTCRWAKWLRRCASNWLSG